MNTDVENFLSKAKQWQGEMKQLRAIILKSGLEEGFKWRQPCYSFEGSNVAIIQPFKNFLGLMFFKGTLLKDPKKILIDNGPNSQAARRIEFRSLEEITKRASVIAAYIKEAIALEKSGQKIEFKKPVAMPAELKKALAKDAKLKKAFAELTPGRQRAYIMHFSGAKQSATRRSRIEKCIPRILKRLGFND